jgi:hypothetical protein
MTIEFAAQSDAEFVVGSAVPHDHDLVLSYPPYTRRRALREAAAGSAIRRALFQEADFKHNLTCHKGGAVSRRREAREETPIRRILGSADCFPG